jgi:hypothetical protein
LLLLLRLLLPRGRKLIQQFRFDFGDVPGARVCVIYDAASGAKQRRRRRRIAGGGSGGGSHDMEQNEREERKCVVVELENLIYHVFFTIY